MSEPAGPKRWAMVALAAAAPIVLLALPPDPAALFGLAILIIIVVAAFRDKVEALRTAAATEPDRTPGTEPQSASTARLPYSTLLPKPKPLRSFRSRLLLTAAAVTAAGTIVYSLYLILQHVPECLSSSFDTFRLGPNEPNQALFCVDLAKEQFVGGVMVTVLALTNLACAVVDFRSEKKRAWLKLSWFPLLAFLSSGPLPWVLNLIFEAILLLLGAAILWSIESGTRLGRRRGRVPFLRLSVGVLAVAALTGAGMRAQYVWEIECRRTEGISVDPNTAPRLAVTHSVSLEDRIAIQDAARRVFENGELFSRTDIDPAAYLYLKAVAMQGKYGVGFFGYHDADRNIRGIASVMDGRDGWEVGSISIENPMPVAFAAIGATEHGYALAGNVSETATTVEVVDRCGAVVDRTSPLEGDFVLITDGPGQIRALHESEPIAANPYLHHSPSGRFGPLDAESRKAADAFTQDLLEHGWSSTLDLVEGDDPAALVAPFGAILTGHFSKDGSPREGLIDQSYPAYNYGLVGENGRPAELLVQLVDGGQGWQVARLEFYSGPSPRVEESEPSDNDPAP